MLKSKILPAAIAASVVAVSVSYGQPPPDTGRQEELLAKYDRNGDGRLSPEEISAARREGPPPPGREKSEQPAKAGQIKHVEEIERILERYDRDGSGNLDYEEMNALRNASKREREAKRGKDES